MKTINKFIAALLSGYFVFPINVTAQANKLNQQSKMNMTMQTDTATFGTGCFWCTEAIFQSLNGVISATSGYSGGERKNPTYEQVCSGATGHAECINIVYDPQKISFVELLEAFWKSHDITKCKTHKAMMWERNTDLLFFITTQCNKKLPKNSSKN